MSGVLSAVLSCPFCLVCLFVEHLEDVVHVRVTVPLEKYIAARLILKHKHR